MQFYHPDEKMVKGNLSRSITMYRLPLLQTICQWEKNPRVKLGVYKSESTANLQRRYILSVWLLLFFINLLLISSIFAQNTFKRNSVYGELLGNGIYASINYERQLKNTPGFGLRLGVGHYSGDEVFRLSIPVGVNYLFRLKGNRSFLDAGIGATWSQADGLRTSRHDLIFGRDASERIWNIVPGIGYRRHTKNNIMWRTSFTPIINKYRFIPMIGLSIGMCF